MRAPIRSDALTHAQQNLVLQAIALHAGTLNALLIDLQAELKGGGAVLNAAQFMAEAIGAMADDAVGGSVAGDVRDWFYGPLFYGAAAQGRA